MERVLLPQNTKVAVFAPTVTAFVERDVDVLSPHVGVRLAEVGISSKPVRSIVSILRIIRYTWQSEVTLTWFASEHAAVAVACAKFLRRKSIVMIGGYDVAQMPEIGYGLRRGSRIRRSLSRYAIDHSDLCFAVHEALAVDSLRNVKAKRKPRILPTGYDPEFWCGGRKHPIVLTVAAVADVPRALVKGLDVLLEVAHECREVEFRVIGPHGEAAKWLQAEAPKNLKVKPPLAPGLLRDEYSRAAVFFLPSRREGLPNALCEAMLSHCIPVASDLPGTRDLVAGLGILVPPGNAESAKRAVLAALDAPAELGERARARVATRYHSDFRREGLMAAIEELRK